MGLPIGSKVYYTTCTLKACGRRCNCLTVPALLQSAFGVGGVQSTRFLGFSSFPAILSNHIENAGKKTGGESFSGIFWDEHFTGNDIFFCFGEYGGKASAQTVCGESL